MKKQCLAWCVFFMMLSGLASAQGVFHAVITNWEPYGYMDNGRVSGFEPEIFTAVMAMLDKRVEYDDMPWKRCLSMVRNGDADAVISLIRTAERESYMFFSVEAISLSETAFFTTASNTIEYDGSLETMKNHVIGVTSGYSYGPAFDSAGYLIKDDATTTEQVIRKLLAGRYAIAIGNIAVVTSISRKIGQADQIRFLKPLVHSEPLYVGFSKIKVTEDAVQAFSKALAEFKSTPAYRDILIRYGVNKETGTWNTPETSVRP